MTFTISTGLWTHQREMVDFAKDRLRNVGYCWWVAGCAVGKTLASLQTAKELGVRKMLVLTTKAAITSAWEIDIAQHTEGLECVALTKGNSTAKIARMQEALLSKEPVCVVVNYETARIMADKLGSFTGFQMVVADESHKLQAHNSQLSNKLALACERITYRLEMTGTPWDDRPLQVFGQVRFLKPWRCDRSVQSHILGYWGDFFDEYTRYYVQDDLKIPYGYKNLERLNRIINPFTVHVDSEEVLSLPPEIDLVRYVDMKGELKRLYETFEKDMIAYLGKDVLIADNRLVLSLRLHQLTGGFYQPYDKTEPIKEIPHISALAKVHALLEILDEIGGKPTVVFTRFKTDVQRIQQELAAKKIETKLLVGGLHQHVEWQAGAGQVLIANISAGAAGINLSRARYCVYYSTGHSNVEYNQSRYRVRRPTSDASLPITYYHIVMRKSIDVEIRAALQSKGEVANCLLKSLEHRVKSSKNG